MPQLRRWATTIVLATTAFVACGDRLRAEQPPSWAILPDTPVTAAESEAAVKTDIPENTPLSHSDEDAVRSNSDVGTGVAGLTPAPTAIPRYWWSVRVQEQLTARDRWVQFDLETILLDTLANSPRVKSVSYQASSTFQKVIQQDAAFDPSILLSSDLGATNEPVGNSLTTGGADRLRDKSLNFKGGARQLTRRGTEVEWTQELGFLDSNSSFFVPNDQGNARLSLGLTKPLLARGQRYYNERLITEARFESRIAWHEMRGAVEQRIADVIRTYWQLYEVRAQVLHQRRLIDRSDELVKILKSREGFDAARIELVKAEQRMSRRTDQLIELEAEMIRLQSRLATLIGSEALQDTEQTLELIPIESPEFSPDQLNLRDAMAQALEYRPEIRAAMHDLELSAFELQISRVELQPQLNWVFNGYLAQLNGASKIARSFGEQFDNAPGISTALEFELPRGRRAARAQQREALLRSKQNTERLRETIKQTQFEVETALIDVERFQKQREIKQRVLKLAIDEENILMVNWKLIGGDDSRVGIKLENLLDAQQRRADAEKDLVIAEASSMIAMMNLQRAMGTLLINEGIRPHQSRCSGEIEFFNDPIDSVVFGEDGYTEVITFDADVELDGESADATGPVETAPRNVPPAKAVPVETEADSINPPAMVPEPFDPLSLDAPLQADEAKQQQPRSESLPTGPSSKPDQRRKYPAPRRLPPIDQASRNSQTIRENVAAHGPTQLAATGQAKFHEHRMVGTR
ncbi:TolC family protein [Roseiconus lacunae]|uniref:TolC family protein n=1 Tax=Roseiconus lacunae TaxID=2605694 RepID=UPI0011F1A0BE